MLLRTSRRNACFQRHVRSVRLSHPHRRALSTSGIYIFEREPIIEEKDRAQWFCNDQTTKRFEEMLERAREQGSTEFNIRKLTNMLTDSNTSSWLRGTLYEYYVLKFLKRFNFVVTRTGRAGDGGIDFSGNWILPDKTIPILGQCKNPLSSKNIGSKHIRDFAGALDKYSQHGATPIGVFVSRTGYTRPAQYEANMSSKPMILMVANEERMESIFLNPSVQKQLPRLIVARDYKPRANLAENDDVQSVITEPVFAYTN